MLVTARDKDMTHCLLGEWGIDFIDRGAGGSGTGGWMRRMAALTGRAWYLLRVVVRLLPVVRRFRPHLVVSWSSYHAALMGRLLGVPVLTFEDTESSVLLHRVNRFLSTRMVTPAAFETGLGRKHIRFEGWKELASLHPSRFTPAALPAGVEKPYIIMRFVSWNAWHDKGHTGMSDAAKREVVRRLSEFGTVYISSEKMLPAGMQGAAMPGGCGDVHTLLAGSSLFFGESACMAAEAAVLGVPAFFIDNEGRGFTRELERLGLLFSYGEDDGQVAEALKKAVSLLSDPGTGEEWQRRRRKALEGKPDITALMIEMAEKFADRG